MTKPTDSTSIQIPAALHAKIRSRMDRTDFETTQEYVLFVLEEVVRDGSPTPEGAESSVDDEKLQRRLEDLGYR